MSETTGEFLIAALLLLAALCLPLVKSIWRTAELNRDPTQRELGAIIIEYANSDLGERATYIFAVSTERALLGGMILERKDQQTRLAHALSMVRPALSPKQYDFVRSVLRASA